ncbi:MAG: cyclic nucleotide-binding domain-containing protein [Gemmatimonadetes bacterium]|jgi:CRP-like cAMP-binding protein|nr:cyclic nucleotide-binding domain-containing protein [Gemmatimonadota bacterium]MBT5324777.1 cyclic nucleotide-binding domain-containing protein [Gemmatimonadota bacterium]MBT5452695.1 cyclic nucleotide-binding domain-containing protein [Gemmatimonadota bacterium]MBT5800590.1 cyclic nucleotide-binding domain-containing protein [Gemmatimonadota bacterium]MBT6620889.1 cyclic nucleotide-binding domain-containing protein [Gemmatimonadota bacterium]
MTTTSRQDLIPLIAQHPFSADLAASHLIQLTEGTALTQFALGKYLAHEDERAEFFCLVVKGIVALETGQAVDHAIAVQSLEPGEVLGWSWFVAPHRWGFDARAIEEVQVLAFNAEYLRRLCENDHELGYQMLNRVVQVTTARLIATRRQLVENTRVLYNADHLATTSNFGKQIVHYISGPISILVCL